MIKLSGTCLILLVLTALSGCATISMKNSWKDPAAPSAKYGRLLIVGIATKPQMRQIFEEVYAAEMNSAGEKAVASYTLTGVKEKPNRESLQLAVKETGADAVVTTRVVGIKEDKDIRTGFIMTDRGYSYPNFAGSEVYPADLFGFYGATVSYATFDHQSVEVTMSRVATIETNVFDAKTGRLVWSATTSAVDPEGVITLSRELADIVIKALARDGLI